MESKGSNLQHPISPAEASSRSFYKIILPFHTSDHKLRIPEEFSKKYGAELSTSVMLTARNGLASHVRLEKADEMLWFTDGWKEFSENHSINCGFFLVFNYEGNSKFNVLIFDLTATEIYNPRNTVAISKEPYKRKRCPLSKKAERGGNEFGKTLGPCPPSRPSLALSQKGILGECRNQSRSAKRCCRSLIQNMYEVAPEFALRINERVRCISSLEILRSNFPYLTRNKLYKMEDRDQIVKAKNVTRSVKGKMKACEMTNSQRLSEDKLVKEKWNLRRNAENVAAVPFVQHCFLCHGGRLKSPINKKDKEGKHKKSDAVLVKESIQMRKDGQQLKGKSREEEELLGVNHSLNISMIPRVMTQDSEKTVSVATMLKTNNPSFTKTMRSYNVHNTFVLRVPAIFSRKYLQGVSNSIHFQISNVEQWKVRCLLTDGGIVQSFCGGWSKFSKDNNLLEDDVCVFELIQTKCVVLKVSIFRAR